MRISKNSLQLSDVTTVPIKVKYTASFYSSSISGSGIELYLGINEPIGPIHGYSQEAMIYRSVKHMFYSNYLSGSFPNSSSYYDNWLQSTAASGSYEADVRLFSTGSYEFVQVVSIPRSVYGEKISPKSFRLVSSGSYSIYDDGNGNIVDFGTGSYSNTVNALYETNQSGYYSQNIDYTSTTHIGNIFYSQGIVVITNQNYADVFGDLQYLLQEDDSYLLLEDSYRIIL